MICKIDNHSVYYEEIGSGKPILCIHGFPEDHRTMLGCVEPIMESLDHYRRIYIDLPGFGSSEINPGIKNADDMLSFLINFIKEVIKDESFLLVGQSYGGYLSLGLMSKANLNISGVFLLCPCVISKHENRNLAQKEILVIEQDLKPEASEKDEFQDFMDYAVVATTKTWERYKSEIMSGLKDADIDYVNTYQKDGYGFSFETSLKDINFNKPIVVLTGKQDNCVGYEDTWGLVKHLPRLTFLCLDKAGHNLQIENKPLFDLHFHDWLNNCS